MDLVSNPDRAGSVVGDLHVALVVRFEGPDGVVVFWVLDQLVGRQRGHGAGWR